MTKEHLEEEQELIPCPVCKGHGEFPTLRGLALIKSNLCPRCQGGQEILAPRERQGEDQ